MAANFGHEFPNLINNLPNNIAQQLPNQQQQLQQQQNNNNNNSNLTNGNNSMNSTNLQPVHTTSLHQYTMQHQQQQQQQQRLDQRQLQQEQQQQRLDQRQLQCVKQDVLDQQRLQQQQQQQQRQQQRQQQTNQRQPPQVPIKSHTPKKRKKQQQQIQEELPDGEHKFECQVCDFKTNVKYSLSSHMKLHQDANYECNFCDKKFKQHQGLTHHMKRIHKLKSLRPRGRPKQNGTESKGMNILDGSSGVYLDDPGYKCLDCEFSSPNLQALSSHLLMHRAGQAQKVSNTKQSTECDKCGESFKTVQSLDYHKSHVCIRTCSYCGLRLKTVDRFKIHEKIGCIVIPEDELENGMCSSCPSGLELKLNMSLDRVDRWNLLAMHKRVCPEPSTFNTCSLCGRTCGDERKL